MHTPSWVEGSLVGSAAQTPLTLPVPQVTFTHAAHHVGAQNGVGYKTRGPLPSSWEEP